MDIDLLRAFLAVAELENLSRAAKTLHISQPALSRQMQRLAHTIGVPLFTRTGRGIRLTEAGLRLQQHARPLVRGLKDLIAVIRAEEGEISGTVRLAVPPSFSPKIIAELLARMHLKHPQIQVRVSVLLTGVIHKALLSDRLDLGILYAPISDTHLHTQDLWQEHLALMTPPDTVLPNPLTMKTALQMPLLVPSPGHRLRDLVEASALLHQVKPNIAFELNSLRLIVACLRQGLGISFLRREAVAESLAAGHLVAHSLADPALIRQGILAWPRTPQTAAAQVLHGCVVRALAA